MENGNIKIFVTGALGQLGRDVCALAEKEGFDLTASDLSPGTPCFKNYVPLDITKKDDVLNAILKENPDAIIHCAAYTDVDKAEDEPALAKKINGEGTENIALAAKKTGSKLIYISTDYVFGGEGDEPFDPDCKNFSPLNVYGESKLLGEKAVAGSLEKYFIVRISWVFGLYGRNFVKTMLNLSKNHDTVKVVNDQIGTPAFTEDLAPLLLSMVKTDKYGFYNAANEGGYISWYEFAKEIYNLSGINTKVLPVTTEEYGLSKAKRPKNSRLDKSKLCKEGFKALPPWRDALKRFLEEIKYAD